ncbi:hypothetical protein [Actinophytocola sp.]|uniref:hypothetical protein n=1 Tax=Actinophytocola sp. TaxID=1872138 RepID=UPI003D6C6D30
MASPAAQRTAIARACRYGDHDEANRLRRVYKAGRLAEHIKQVVSTAPPLTTEQVEQLRSLLRLPTTEEAA